MCASPNLLCDGCGQPASPAHIAARLLRLEWATRYRPLHINALILGAVAPQADDEFVYSDAPEYRGHAAALFRVAGITAAGKSPEVLHHDLQRTGLFLTYVLDCPQPATSDSSLPATLAARLPFALKRIRTSLKPKRVLLVTPELDPLIDEITSSSAGCPVLSGALQTFKLDDADEAVERIRAALGAPLAAAP